MTYFILSLLGKEASTEPQPARGFSWCMCGEQYQGPLAKDRLGCSSARKVRGEG